MEEKEFDIKSSKGEIKEIGEKEVEQEAPEMTPKMTFEDYQSFLEMLRRFKQHGDSVPTHTPKSFLEQFYFYESGGTRILYVYINGAWHNATAMINPMTAANDIIKGGAGGTPVALAPSSGSVDFSLRCRSGTEVVEWAQMVLNFVDLADTPALLTGHGGKTVKVNAGATALEFVTAGITFCDTQVFNDTIAGVGWTDLDLSGTVGSNRAMVYLRVKKTAAGDGTYFFREDDEAQNNVVFETISNQNDIFYVWVLTDASGVIEWKNPEQKVTEIRVRCYLK